MKARNILKNIAIVLVIIFSIYSLTCNAQYIGGNGAGFFENYNADAETWLKELNQDFTLRVPGGAIAKFADPATNAKGWGLTYAGIDSIQTKYGSPDEEDQTGALSKWHGRADAQPNRSYLSDLATLQATFPGMRVIWVANVFIPAERTKTIISTLIANGVNVVAIEMGNETYAQLNYDFNKYKQLVTPIAETLKNTFPDIPISHISAPIGKGRKEQDNWNSQLTTYLTPGDFVTLHYYIGEREVFGLSELPERKTVNYNAPDEILDLKFFNIAVELLGLPHEVITTAKELYAGHTLLITETNTQPSVPLGDTYLNSAYQFRFLLEQRNAFNTIAWHNFVAPDIYGMICLRKKDEPGNTPLIKRTTYYSFDLVGDISTQAPEMLPENKYIFSAPGTYQFYFENLRGNPYTPLIEYQNTKLDSVTVTYIHSDYLSGNKLSKVITHVNEIPPAYGYITYSVSNTIKPEPCIKPKKCSRFFYNLFNKEKCNCPNA